jgi:hypothetical protein
MESSLSVILLAWRLFGSSQLGNQLSRVAGRQLGMAEKSALNLQFAVFQFPVETALRIFLDIPVSLLSFSTPLKTTFGLPFYC